MHSLNLQLNFYYERSEVEISCKKRNDISLNTNRKITTFKTYCKTFKSYFETTSKWVHSHASINYVPPNDSIALISFWTIFVLLALQHLLLIHQFF